MIAIGLVRPKTRANTVNVVLYDRLAKARRAHAAKQGG